MKGSKGAQTVNLTVPAAVKIQASRVENLRVGAGRGGSCLRAFVLIVPFHVFPYILLADIQAGFDERLLGFAIQFLLQ